MPTAMDKPAADEISVPSNEVVVNGSQLLESSSGVFLNFEGKMVNGDSMEKGNSTAEGEVVGRDDSNERDGDLRSISCGAEPCFDADGLGNREDEKMGNGGSIEKGDSVVGRKGVSFADQNPEAEKGQKMHTDDVGILGVNLDANGVGDSLERGDSIVEYDPFATLETNGNMGSSSHGARVQNFQLNGEQRVRAEVHEASEKHENTTNKEVVKRRRGRPPKNHLPVSKQWKQEEDVRHLDSSTPIVSICNSGKKPRGRPPKKYMSEDGNKQKSVLKQWKQEEDARLLDTSPLISPMTISGKKRRGRPPKNHVSQGDNEEKKLPKQMKQEVVGRLDCSTPVASCIRSGKKRRGGTPKSHEPEDVHRIDSSNPVPSSVKSGKRPRGRPRKNRESPDAREQKSLSKQIEEEEEDVHHNSNGDEVGPEVEFVSQESAKKCKAGSQNETPSLTCNRSLNVGHCTSQVACQPEDSSYVREMLSQLCSVATNPKEGHSFLSVVTGFFTDIRRLLASNSSEAQEPVKSVGRKRGRKKKVGNSEPSSSIMSELPGYMQDSYWSDIRVESSPEREPVSRERKRKRDTENSHQNKKAKPVGEPSLSAPMEPSLDTEHCLLTATSNPNGKQEVEGERIGCNSEENINEETPTALILTFNDSDHLPSTADLIRIFSPYGPLCEEEIEILRKTSRAYVVFRYRDDAVKAFSSAGEHSVFGQAVVSYRLRNLPLPKISPANFPPETNDAATNKNVNLEPQAHVGTGVACN